MYRSYTVYHWVFALSRGVVQVSSRCWRSCDAKTSVIGCHAGGWLVVVVKPLTIRVNVVVTSAMRFELENVSYTKPSKLGSSQSPINWLKEIGFFFEVGFF